MITSYALFWQFYSVAVVSRLYVKQFMILQLYFYLFLNIYYFSFNKFFYKRTVFLAHLHSTLRNISDPLSEKTLSVWINSFLFEWQDFHLYHYEYRGLVMCFLLHWQDFHILHYKYRGLVMFQNCFCSSSRGIKSWKKWKHQTFVD